MELRPAAEWHDELLRRVQAAGPAGQEARRDAVRGLIRDVQRNALEAAAARCRKQYWSEDDVYADLVLALLKDVG